MTYETITLSVSDSIARLTLNRPEVFNALDWTMLRELRSALDLIAVNPAARVLLLTGAGKAFCAGADLTVHKVPGADTYETKGDEIAAAMYEHHNRVVQKLWDMPMPVVSAINGVAAGGGIGLALTADVTIAARSSSFVCVFGPKLGIVPDMGTTFHLQRLVGRARALGIAMLGDRICADQAEQWGLVYRMVEDAELEQVATSLAAQLAAGPRLAFPRIRAAFAHAETATMSEQLAWEAEAQRALCSTNDFMEGVSAFTEKRAPRFSGT
ncbi:MAG: enoyl-CoA hydratase-related protein [Panacagrimonas sp.]